MKKNIIIALAVLLIGGGVLAVVLTRKATTKPPSTAKTEEIDLSLPEVAKTVSVTVTKNKVKDNTIVIDITGLEKKYTKVAYELSYETQGKIEGVTAKPIDIADKEVFTRDDIYLGTCSKNVCRPHVGVTKIGLVLEFTATDGQKSQFSKTFEL